MTKGRAALPLSVVAEQKLFFITLGGPKAHDFSGRDDKGEDCYGPRWSGMAKPQVPPLRFAPVAMTIL